MKTTQTARFPTKSIAVRFLFSVIIVSGLIIPSVAFAQDAAKTHTLFMGADVSVGRETDKDVRAVKDVTGSSWVIDVNGQTKVVSSKNGPLNIRVTPVLKLTEVSATLANLKGAPSYTSGNDPAAKLTKDMDSAAGLNAGYQAAVNTSQAALTRAEVNAGAITATNNMDAANMKAAGIPGGIPMTPDQGAANSNLQTASLAASAAQTSVSVGADMEMTGDRGVAQGCDAMEVTFGVSSAFRLSNPYVVIITQFSEKGGKPGMVRKMVYAKALDPIDIHPKSIDVFEGGFPPGFELKDYEVHLYNQGQEIATNVSSKRVELSRDEAFEYIKVVYLGSHKGETLPAAPVMGKLPADLPARLAEGKYGDTFYVKVSKDGLAEESFLDAACTKRISDPYLESVVKGVRFKPALENGSPVNGVAALKLGQLAI